MINIKTFTCNPFQVNSYLLFDETGECVLIDSACYNKAELDEIVSFISSNNLILKNVLYTHGHVDHVLGSSFVINRYNVEIIGHQADEALIDGAVSYGAMFGLEVNQPLKPNKNISDGDVVKFGKSELLAIHVPGHSMGSIVYYSASSKFIISGDVLFCGSIGRTDLPGGDYDVLISGIRNKLLVLDSDVAVYPGHGDSTTIGDEKRENPFL